MTDLMGIGVGKGVGVGRVVVGGGLKEVGDGPLCGLSGVDIAKSSKSRKRLID